MELILTKKKQFLPGSTKPQDFGAAPGYQTQIYLKNNQLIQLKVPNSYYRRT